MKNYIPTILSLYSLSTIVFLVSRADIPFLPSDALPALLPLILVYGTDIRRRMLYMLPPVFVTLEIPLILLLPACGTFVPMAHAMLVGICLLTDAFLSYSVCWREALHGRRRRICRIFCESWTRLLILALSALLLLSAEALFPDGRTWGAVGTWLWAFLTGIVWLLLAVWLTGESLRRRLPEFRRNRIAMDLRMLQEKESESRHVTAQSDPARNLFDRAVDLMVNKQTFLLYEFTLNDMAQRLYTNKMYLSRTINTFSGRGYRSFVNYFRIQYSLKLFRENMGLKVHMLAELSGFHSQVTYTTAFKLETGMTPGEYFARIIQGLEVPEFPAVPSIQKGLEPSK